MNQFGLTDEHVMMRETLRALIERDFVPIVEQAERDHVFPRELITRLAANNLIGLKYPVELGGQGLDLLAECLLIEEMTRASAGASSGVFVHTHLAISPILYYGTDDLRERFAGPALRGELIGGFAVTEPSAGSDVQAIRTRAVREGDSYRINGQKLFITNGTIADYLILAAYTRPDAGTKGMSLIVVPTDAPGFEARPLKKLGNWSADTAEVFLDDVVVPCENLVGPEEGGFSQVMKSFVEGRILVSTRPLALAEMALEASARYAKERHAFGHQIGHYQGVSHKIARMAAEVDAARLLIYRAAHLHMAGRDCAIEASKAKYFTTTLAQRAVTEALHIHGGYGFTTDFKVERLYRDAPECMIGEGTAEIQLRIIARSLGLS